MKFHWDKGIDGHTSVVRNSLIKFSVSVPKDFSLLLAVATIKTNKGINTLNSKVLFFILTKKAKSVIYTPDLALQQAPLDKEEELII